MPQQARAVRCAAASVAEPQVASAPADTFPTAAARQAAFTEDILPDQVTRVCRCHVNSEEPAELRCRAPVCSARAGQLGAEGEGEAAGLAEGHLCAERARHIQGREVRPQTALQNATTFWPASNGCESTCRPV